MIQKTKYIILLVIFITAFIASAILSFLPPEKACGGVETSCYTVQTSDYETTLEINNSYFGLIGFTLLGIFTYSYIKKPKKYKKNVMGLGILFCSTIAIYFLYLQFFVLEAICKYCMVIDVGTLLALGIFFGWRKR